MKNKLYNNTVLKPCCHGNEVYILEVYKQSHYQTYALIKLIFPTHTQQILLYNLQTL